MADLGTATVRVSVEVYKNYPDAEFDGDGLHQCIDLQIENNWLPLTPRVIQWIESTLAPEGWRFSNWMLLTLDDDDEPANDYSF